MTSGLNVVDASALEDEKLTKLRAVVSIFKCKIPEDNIKEVTGAKDLIEEQLKNYTAEKEINVGSEREENEKIPNSFAPFRHSNNWTQLNDKKLNCKITVSLKRLIILNNDGQANCSLTDEKDSIVRESDCSSSAGCKVNNSDLSCLNDILPGFKFRDKIQYPNSSFTDKINSIVEETNCSSVISCETPVDNSITDYDDTSCSNISGIKKFYKFVDKNINCSFINKKEYQSMQVPVVDDSVCSENAGWKIDHSADSTFSNNTFGSHEIVDKMISTGNLKVDKSDSSSNASCKIPVSDFANNYTDPPCSDNAISGSSKMSKFMNSIKMKYPHSSFIIEKEPIPVFDESVSCKVDRSSLNNYADSSCSDDNIYKTSNVPVSNLLDGIKLEYTNTFIEENDSIVDESNYLSNVACDIPLDNSVNYYADPSCSEDNISMSSKMSTFFVNEIKSENPLNELGKPLFTFDPLTDKSKQFNVDDLNIPKEQLLNTTNTSFNQHNEICERTKVRNSSNNMLNKKIAATAIKSYRHCTLCGSSFSCIEELLFHVNDIHHNVEIYKCDLCENSFSEEFDFIDHLRNKHHPLYPNKVDQCESSFIEEAVTKRTYNKIYKCNMCNFISSTNSSFVNHMRTNHQIWKPFKCKFCKSRFKCNSHLNEHMSAIHDSNTFKCNRCSKTFKTRGYLRKHIIQCHKLERNHVQINNYISIKAYDCDECENSFSEEFALTEHMKIKHSPNPNNKVYLCDICNLDISFSGASFKRHMQMHHQILSPFKCKLCSCQYTCASNLNDHVSAIHDIDNDFTYTCNECSVTFKRRSGLMRHNNRKHKIPKNIKKRPFEFLNSLNTKSKKVEKPNVPTLPFIKNKVNCVMDNNLSEQYDLVNPTLKPQKMEVKKQFNCFKCEFSSDLQVYFFNHLEVNHNLHNFYECDKCKTYFNDINGCLSHLESTHNQILIKPYFCVECEERFCEKKSLINHMKLHNIPCYKCRKCSSTFTEQNRLIEHQLEVHMKQLFNYVVN